MRFLIERIERILDKDGKETHTAVVKLRKSADISEEYRVPFPDYTVGMEVELDEKGRFLAVGGEGLSEKTTEILYHNGLFFYELKEALPFPDIALVCGTQRDMYLMWKSNPFYLTTLCKENGEPIATFPKIDEMFTATTWSERLNEYRHAARYVLMKNEESGNTCLPYKEFKEAFCKLLEKNRHPMRTGSPSAILRHFSDEFYLEEPFLPGSMVAFQETRRKEAFVYSSLRTTQNKPTLFPRYNPEDVGQLTDEQKDAVKKAVSCRGRIAILTGGPGTGKTTVIDKIVETMEKDYPKVQIRLMAPTGKASKRISEVMSHRSVKVSTIHKFLGYGQRFMTSENRAYIKASGLVIVDESSMLDLEIFAQLLEKIDLEKCKVILVGDVNQLPSIGAGNILHDLIELGAPTFYLTKAHRFAGTIAKNAERINKGCPHLLEGEDFLIHSENNSVGWYYAGTSALNTDKTVISPYKTQEQEGSSYYINELIQKARFEGLSFRNGKFYVGDHVIFVRTSSYQSGSLKNRNFYYNGETGIVIGYNRAKGAYQIKKSDGELVDVCDDNDIELGYSITIHKSQGSEYGHVVLSIPKFSNFVTRKMLYTVITRAKEAVTIYASKQVLGKIILNNRDDTRYTLLSLWAEKDKQAET